MLQNHSEVCGSLACDEPEVQSLAALKIKVPLPKWRQTCVSIKTWVVPTPLSSCRACSILWDRRWKEGNVPSPAVGSGHFRRSKGRQVPREAICQTRTINAHLFSPALWCKVVIRCQSSWVRWHTLLTASGLLRDHIRRQISFYNGGWTTEGFGSCHCAGRKGKRVFSPSDGSAAICRQKWRKRAQVCKPPPWIQGIFACIQGLG